MRQCVILMAMSLLTAACYDGAEYLTMAPNATLVLDVALDEDPDDVEAIVDAAEAWSVATGGFVDLKLRFGRFRRDDDANNIAAGPRGEGGVTLTSDEREPDILLDVDLDRHTLTLLAMHELGHAFGVPHDRAPDHLMSATFARDLPLVVDEFALNEFWKRH